MLIERWTNVELTSKPKFNVDSRLFQGRVPVGSCAFPLIVFLVMFRPKKFEIRKKNCENCKIVNPGQECTLKGRGEYKKKDEKMWGKTAKCRYIWSFLLYSEMKH
jgi:hypothetical protein